MSLQVRVRHALGQRLIELEDRSAERPLIVGRASQADVKVPSITVANQHCALFVHEGQWIVQDASGGATFLNGEQVVDPTPLHIGDMIVLGSDANPAVIDIDPASADQGLTGQPAMSQSNGSASAASRGGTPASRPVAASATSYGVAPPQIAPRAQAANPDDPFGEWGQPSAAQTPPRRRKPAKQSSEVGMILCVAAIVIVIGGTGWFAYHQSQKREALEKPAAPVDDTPHIRSMFDDPAAKARQSSALPAPAKVSPPTPRPAPVAPSSDNDTPAAPPADAPEPKTAGAPADDSDAAWEEVVSAHYTPEYGRNILKFDDYARQNPGKHADTLAGYVNEAVDRLWCARIANLCTRRAALRKQIHMKETEINQEPSAEFKKKLTDEKTDMEKQLALAEDTLNTDMGYTADEIPDLSKADTFAELTTNRDTAKFADWKTHTLSYIRKNHGVTAWDGE